MNKVFGLFIGGHPLPQPRPRGRVMYVNGKPIVSMYEGDNGQRKDGLSIHKWKETIALAINSELPKEPLDGTLRCDLSFYFPRPQYAVDQPKYPDHPYFHDKQCDVDNLAKPVLDTLQSQKKGKYTFPRFFNNDGQVAGGLWFKFFCARNPFFECPISGLPLGRPGVYIRLYTLDYEDLPHAKTLFTPETTAIIGGGPKDRLKVATRTLTPS